jgi:hypothetical protein
MRWEEESGSRVIVPENHDDVAIVMLGLVRVDPDAFLKMDTVREGRLLSPKQTESFLVGLSQMAVEGARYKSQEAPEPLTIDTSQKDLDTALNLAGALVTVEPGDDGYF